MHVPEGWERCKLQDITQEGFRNGFSSTEVQKETGYYVLGLGALTGEGIDLTQIKNIEYSENWESAQIFAGDFLISRSNTPDKVGRVAQYKGGLENCSYPDLMVKFKINSKRAISSYIEYFLQSSTTQYYYQRFSGGSSRSMVKINQSTIGNTPLLIPPLAEQEKIAEILSTWDHAIEQTERLKANAETHKQALMQQLLTGKKRFPEFGGEWKKTLLKDLLREIKKDKVENAQNYELLTVRLHHKGIVRSGKYPRPTKRGRPYYFRYAGELIIGRQNLHNGGIGIADKSVDGCIASNAISSFQENNSDLLFIYYIMTTPRFIYDLNSVIGGTGQKEISNRELLRMSVKVPCLDEQQKIASVLNTADREIELLTQKIEHLKSEKRALMQQLLTGKRRVKVDG